ncbi:MAG TPA: hypothetical protein VG900_11390 [Hyphomicrobiaceae bacterium]|jgi:hypothetical protein|nr:hypothetical protein [Hyphomicrobiaceae bacterium]
MLSALDRHLKARHLWVANGVAIAWFIGITVASRVALPKIKLFRCPVGFCAGGYAPEELRATLDAMGEEGRDFLENSLLPLDLLLPFLLFVAFATSTVWFSRSHGRFSVPLKSGARYALLAVPLCYCLADYAENWAVAALLRDYPDINDHLARTASELTAAKSQLVAASLGICVALAIAAWGAAHRLGSGDGGQTPPSHS